MRRPRFTKWGEGKPPSPAERGRDATAAARKAATDARTPATSAASAASEAERVSVVRFDADQFLINTNPIAVREEPAPRTTMERLTAEGRIVSRVQVAPRGVTAARTGSMLLNGSRFRQYNWIVRDYVSHIQIEISDRRSEQRHAQRIVKEVLRLSRYGGELVDWLERHAPFTLADQILTAVESMMDMEPQSLARPPTQSDLVATLQARGFTHVHIVQSLIQQHGEGWEWSPAQRRVVRDLLSGGGAHESTVRSQHRHLVTEAHRVLDRLTDEGVQDVRNLTLVLDSGGLLNGRDVRRLRSYIGVAANPGAQGIRVDLDGNDVEGDGYGDDDE